MEVHKRYNAPKFAGNISKLLNKQSNILRFFPNQYEGSFTTKENEFNGKGVPAVFFERTMDIGEAEIEDISKRVGCPEAMNYTCMLGDDFAISLTHEIKKGVKLQRCNASQFSTSVATQLAQAVAGVATKNAEKIDKAHLNTIKKTAPSIAVATVDKTNILQTISGLKMVMEKDKDDTHNDEGFKVVMPYWYETFLKAAYLEHAKISLTFEVLSNGVQVSKVDGVEIELWKNIDFMFAATSDAWATVTACWDARAVRTIYNEMDKNTYVDQALFTGGGYKWQWKNNITDEVVIKNIVMVKESAPASNPMPAVTQSTNFNDGLRVAPKTVFTAHDEAIKQANGDFVAGVNDAGENENGEIDLPNGYEPGDELEK